MHPSTICYIEIPAPDIEKAGLFYKSVFGWGVKASDLTTSRYWEFNTGEGGLTGGLVEDLPVVDGGVILYLKVADIDAALVKIKACGGTVVREKFDIGGGFGFSALFKDPNQNSLGLISVV
jgi:uncharacterized protein